jgi:predicted N-acetyltransferase YhbS
MLIAGSNVKFADTKHKNYRRSITMEIRQMQRDDLEKVLSLLIAAFHNTPFHRHIAPDKAERLRFLDATYRHRIIHALGVNDINLALEGGIITGFASWTPPVLTPTVGQSMDEALVTFSTELRERFSLFLTLLNSARGTVIQQPFWGLGPIAVLPTAQGRGVGAALMRSTLRKIDAAMLPCFLATQDTSNVPLYEHFGFQLVREDVIAETVPHYTMIRNIQ